MFSLVFMNLRRGRLHLLLGAPQDGLPLEGASPAAVPRVIPADTAREGGWHLVCSAGW